MTKHKFFHSSSLKTYISRKLAQLSSGPECFFVFPQLDRQPISDAELKQCKDLLHPIGYTLIEQLEGNEIVLCRLDDLDAEMKLMESVLQKLK